ncbi:MAG TPA: leucyl aminopeptidase family protein, partial [Gammaproteobacteria bacterium]|nr:leucyl aminopeptidase family protein [Gammaproteobacteria bacterium]
PGGKELSKLPYLKEIKQRRDRSHRKEEDKSPLTLDLPNKSVTRVSVACIKAGRDSFALLTLARKLVNTHRNIETIGLVVAGFNKREQERIAETLLAATLAANAEMPVFKKKTGKKNHLKTICLYGVKARDGFRSTFAEAEGNALARSLAMLPPNKLTPADYLKRVKKLAAENKWKLDFYGVSELKKKKAGAFLAVCQGSATQDAGIVRLRYKPAGKARANTLALVGKGICYDTGGVSLKPPRYMFGMHEDMQGSAVALGTFLALSRLKVNYPVECWLALAMNHIGPKSYLPNDVVTACDGTSIEVVNTDAEGRMVLADTLALVSRQKPKLIIDYATLTGACMMALGTVYSGIFTNNEKFHPKLIAAGHDSGERVWPFPQDEDYDRQLQSKIADIKQCSPEGAADHILAARFLKHFVKNDCQWIHVDLASSNHKGGLAHIPTDTTGFGVRYTLNLLLDKKIM